MVHGLLKVEFTKQPENISDVKDTLNFCEKLRRKFHVTTRAKFIDDQLSFIVIAALADDEPKLNTLFDRILEFCDGSEFGRVYENSAFVEDIDELEELNGEPTMEYDP